jgi:hypothetical protein
MAKTKDRLFDEIVETRIALDAEQDMKDALVDMLRSWKDFKDGRGTGGKSKHQHFTSGYKPWQHCIFGSEFQQRPINPLIYRGPISALSSSGFCSAKSSELMSAVSL